MMFKMTKRRRTALIGYSFLALWIIGFLVFTLYPIIFSGYLSVSKMEMGVNGIQYSFEGIRFFKYALKSDTKFLPALLESLGFICYATPIIVIVALLLALMLKGEYKGRTIFRVIFFMPVVIMSGPIISELLGKYSVDFTEASPALFTFIESLPEVFRSPSMFVMQNLVTVLWYSGVQILILLVAIQRISPELYEAASIDGASKWEMFWKITLPYTMPTILVCALYTVIELANDSTNAINVYIADKMFDVKMGYYSYSTAMAWMYTGVIVFVLLLIFGLMKFFQRKER